MVSIIGWFGLGLLVHLRHQGMGAMVGQQQHKQQELQGWVLSQCQGFGGLGEIMEDHRGLWRIMEVMHRCLALSLAAVYLEFNAHQRVVSYACTAPLEGGLEQQWPQLDNACDLLAVAPDDEILAELLALQSELAQQVRPHMVWF